MRELKFRAWDTGAKCYVKDPILVDNFGNVYVVCEEASDKRGTCLITGKPNAILERYTGLKDKNGKEIYEGDILGGIYEHGYIAYCDKCKQLQFFDADMGCMMCIGDICWRDIVESERYGELDGELEVIGNIHENPELIEKEEG